MYLVKTVLNIGVLSVTLLLLLTVGMELKARDLHDLAYRKGALFGALFLPAILLPLLGFGLSRVLALPPHLTAGILLLAACPVGDIANFYTLLARGNLALSVSVNTLSCLLSAATMAVAFELCHRLLGQRFEFALPPLALVLRLTLLVVVPVLIGMVARSWKPIWAAAHRDLLRNLCLIGTVFLLVFVLVNRWAQVLADWRQTAQASVVFMVACLATGLTVARILRLSATDGVTVGILFTVRNVALAGAIAVTILNRIEFAEIALVYFLVEVPLLLGLVETYRRWWSYQPR